MSCATRAQQAHALLRRRRAPGRKRSCRGGHRAIDVLRAGLRERAEQPVAIDRAALVARRRCVDIVAVDVQRVPAAELRAHLAHRRVEARVHLRRRIEHRRVGELVD